ncbi:MAG: malectin domain-containing carbohydrate-binding protein [Acidobacteriota bacterium]
MDFTDVDQQRAELEEVLSSAIFRKAPNQSRLLRYLCEYHFSGNSEPLKEHQIAVEALGRKTDFDQRENSIVRVEVSRVRKKLRQFYESEGSRHSLRIAIDPGQYIPRFETVEAEAIQPESETLTRIVHEAVPFEPPAVPGGGRRSLWLMAAILAIIGILVIAAAWLVWRRDSGVAPAKQSAGPAARPLAQEPFAPLDTGAEVRILAGYPRAFHVDRLGNVWRGDRYFTGGHAAEAPRQIIARTPDPTLYRFYRAGDFKYDIPLKPGVYEMRLHFAQSLAPWTLTDQPAGAFEVYVSINGTANVLKLNFAADGATSSTADVRVFKNISPAGDGKLHLEFHPGAEFSFVNAIEITPGIRNRMQPIRISTREYFYTDHAGLLWPPDRWYRGGSIILRRDAVSGTEDPDLFSSERYGTFDYLIPVAHGTYAVKLGFAETWFGPTLPGGGGAGSRIFDVDCNGMPLVKSLDVYKEAGGAGKVLIKTFHGLQPREDGKLHLTFTPRRNYAMVNTIEVLDETE